MPREMNLADTLAAAVERAETLMYLMQQIDGIIMNVYMASKGNEVVKLSLDELAHLQTAMTDVLVLSIRDCKAALEG